MAAGAQEMASLNARFVPFTAQTRMSGVDIEGATIRKGAVDADCCLCPADERRAEHADASRAGRYHLAHFALWHALAVAKMRVWRRHSSQGHRQRRHSGRFTELRRMGIRTVMITGDNPLTAAAIAAEAGVDDFLAQATPEGQTQA